MDAPLSRTLIVVAALSSVAATFKTPNFVVTAESPEVAQQVGEQAEHFRRDLAKKWLGRELGRWWQPCPIAVKIGQLGAGGNTSFTFDRGEVFGWTMNIQGPLDRVLDSVLPHEVSHTIFACHFRRPLPRWADEGAATLAEDESEKRRQKLLVRQILSTHKRIPLNDLLRIKDYPTDMEQVLNLYAEGYALCELLVQRGGKERYLTFLADAHQRGWETAIKTHYGHRSIKALEQEWEAWIIDGCPGGGTPKEHNLAGVRPRNGSPDAVVRSQNPEQEADTRPQAGKNSNPVAAAPRASGSPQRGQGLNAPQPRLRPETAESLASQIDLGKRAPIQTAGVSRSAGDKSEGRDLAQFADAPAFSRSTQYDAKPTEASGWTPAKSVPVRSQNSRGQDVINPRTDAGDADFQAPNLSKRSPRSKPVRTQ